MRHILAVCILLKLAAFCAAVAASGTAAAKGDLNRQGVELADGNLAFASPFLNIPELAVPLSDDHKRHVLLGKRQAVPEDFVIEFKHGVASGDPLHDALIIWTRVSPSINTIPIHVDWQVSRDPSFHIIAQSGQTLTTSDVDFTVKIDVRGLIPDTPYFFRFLSPSPASDSIISPTGRARTLPAASAIKDHLRIAAVSCANMPHGFYHAYARIADHARAGQVDLVLMLGDYIYEHAPKMVVSGRLRGEREPNPPRITATLADYRTRHSQYRLDKDLQKMHQEVAMIAIPDDHEISDNANSQGAPNHDPARDGPWGERRLGALRAWHEWMPVRPDISRDLFKVFRSFQYGQLASIVLPDLRQRRMLSDEQERWFHGQLTNSSAQWKIVGNQVLLAPIVQQVLGFEIPLTSDAWVGYPRSRTNLLRLMHERKINDTVFLTGDIHSSWASNIYLDELQPYNKMSGQGSLLVEYVGPSVTSQSPTADQRWLSKLAEKIVPKFNKGIHFNDFYRHGYMVLDVNRDRARCEYHFVENVKTVDGGSEYLGAVLETASGSNRITRSFVA
ncbi:PhoD-like phosphatase-domain-containing protein [Catenaria anguillulae PL171]|uniref:PhoD-like phosphatase-domain-containing protein n=1 Tax=Catenaria anguillulae PL171 TaxID=765915 RepID=A0A1Y2HFV6_9FUNG|nr:PhoD-like phosphatase-domain-containing protein [Catenaria anguillulae PL171]